MSTDLHLHHELPKLRIFAVKFDDVATSSLDVDSSVATRAENENGGVLSAPVVNDDDESYRTPTSKESRIPAVTTCPPAPKKPKALASRKRKPLDEFSFFEDTNKEDVDAFFRSTFPKRTCTCT